MLMPIDLSEFLLRATWSTSSFNLMCSHLLPTGAIRSFLSNSMAPTRFYRRWVLLHISSIFQQLPRYTLRYMFHNSKGTLPLLWIRVLISQRYVLTQLWNYYPTAFWSVLWWPRAPHQLSASRFNGLGCRLLLLPGKMRMIFVGDIQRRQLGDKLLVRGGKCYDQRWCCSVLYWAGRVALGRCCNRQRQDSSAILAGSAAPRRTTKQNRNLNPIRNSTSEFFRFFSVLPEISLYC